MSVEDENNLIEAIRRARGHKPSPRTKKYYTIAADELEELLGTKGMTIAAAVEAREALRTHEMHLLTEQQAEELVIETIKLLIFGNFLQQRKTLNADDIRSTLRGLLAKG